MFKRCDHGGEQLDFRFLFLHELGLCSFGVYKFEGEDGFAEKLFLRSA